MAGCTLSFRLDREGLVCQGCRTNTDMVGAPCADCLRGWLSVAENVAASQFHESTEVSSSEGYTLKKDE